MPWGIFFLFIADCSRLAPSSANQSKSAQSDTTGNQEILWLQDSPATQRTPPSILQRTLPVGGP